MNKPWAYMIGAAIPSFITGCLISIDTLHVANKINCPLPIDRYPIEEILLHRKPAIKILGLEFSDGEWEIFEGQALQIYKINCLLTLNHLYQAHNRQDQKLRVQIKSML